MAEELWLNCQTGGVEAAAWRVVAVSSVVEVVPAVVVGVVVVVAGEVGAVVVV